MNNSESKYWYWLNDKINDMFLKFGGYDNFKRTAGNIYNNDFSYLTNKEELYPHNLDIKTVWGLIITLVPKEIYEQFDEPLEGNPLTFLLNGRNVSIDLGCSILEYYKLSKHIDFSKINSICEIGCGYGRTAYVITKLHPNIEYTLIDIEPSLGIAKKYLTSVAEWGKFQFVTPNNFGDNKCDLFIAINCMGEMSKNSIAEYFDYIDKNAKYFYIVTWKDVYVPFENIYLSYPTSYPIKDQWKKLFERDYIRSNWIEALYQI